MDPTRIEAAFKALRVNIRPPHAAIANHKGVHLNGDGEQKHDAASVNGVSDHGDGVNGFPEHATLKEKRVHWADYLSEDDEFQRYLSYQVPGTTCSLFHTEAYHFWHNSPQQASILLEGLSGSGKSMMCAALIDRLQKTEPEAFILYFFFRQSEGNTRSLPVSLVHVWIAKLSQHSVYLAEEFQRMGRRHVHNHNKLPEEAQWEFLLASILSVGTARVYCIVDALDQVDPRQAANLMTRLQAIATLRPRMAKLFMTSRPRKELHSSPLVSSSLYINIDTLITPDINSLVHQQLRKAIPSFDLAHVRANIAKDIMASLPATDFSLGPFSYARVLVDNLTGRDPLSDLTKQPLTVEDVYNVMRLLIRNLPGKGVQTPAKKFSYARVLVDKFIGLRSSDDLTESLLSVEDLPNFVQLLIRRLPGKLSKVVQASGKGNLDWRDHSARDNKELQFVHQLPPDHNHGQTSFRARDTHGVRRYLVRLCIERRIWRDVSQGQRPVLHSLFTTICCSIPCLEVFFEYVEKIDCNSRDAAGRTLIHAACDAKVLKAAYLLPAHAYLPRGEVWYRGTGFFLQILQYNHKADPYAVDNQGRDALQHLLSNPNMCEDHILSFLQKFGSRELVLRKDKRGFTALHHALRNLRPRTCEALLALQVGTGLLERDPDGNTALHHIARQCLCTQRNEGDGIGYSSYETYDEYAAACLRLWRCYLALGGLVDTLDARRLPPLFYYIASACGQPSAAKLKVNGVEHATNGNGKANGKMNGHAHEEEDCMHFQQFYAYFAGVVWEPPQHAKLKKELLNRSDGNEAHYNRLLKHLEKWVLKVQ